MAIITAMVNMASIMAMVNVTVMAMVMVTVLEMMRRKRAGFSSKERRKAYKVRVLSDFMLAIK